MATRRRSPQVAASALAPTRPLEGLRACPQCHGLVVPGKEPGTWLTPVRGDVHDCTAWRALLETLNAGAPV